MRIRKAKAGSDSYGHTWAKDGAVVDVPQEQAWTLLAIPDGGFTDAETHAPGPPASGDRPAAHTPEETAPEETKPKATRSRSKTTAGE